MKKLDINDDSIAHLTLTLLRHYHVKCESHLEAFNVQNRTRSITNMVR